jgi:hypothetical protein
MAVQVDVGRHEAGRAAVVRVLGDARHVRGHGDVGLRRCAPPRARGAQPPLPVCPPPPPPCSSSSSLRARR